MLTRISHLVLAAAAVAGCHSAKPVPADVRGCWGDGCAIVTTSHYNPDFTGVGTINAVQMSLNKVVKGIDSSVDPDTALDISADDKLYVLNRGNGSLRRYDLAKLAVELEIATGTADAPNTLSFPFAMWRKGDGKIYVTLAGNDAAHAVGVLDEAQPNAGVVKYIEVPAAATDSDGRPEAAQLYACQNHLYVTVQDYTIVGRDAVYNGAGRIAVIDLAQDKVTGFIALSGRNPAGLAAEGSDCNKVLVVTSSKLTSEPDGTAGVERVDLAARTSSGFIATDSALAGRPYDIAVVSSTLAYIPVYFDPQTGLDGKVYLGSAKVLAWNPSTGSAIGDATGKAGSLSFAKVGLDHKLYVGIGTFGGMAEPGKLAQGLYVGPADGTPLPTTPIDLGDTPSAIAFQQP
ncbi:MAG: hypothetical protein JWN44_5207 [Myxococcales bacterium]|nr:hypothetical protein [Myxococcales bacterium]